MDEPIYTKGLSVRGNYISSFAFIDNESRRGWIANTLPQLKLKHGHLAFSNFNLDGLKIGDKCYVSGEGSSIYTITGRKTYSDNRPGFILDSGWCEEVVKCYKPQGRINMFSISNNEMKDRPKAKKGDFIKCNKCGKKHELHYGTSDDGSESDVLAFYRCGHKAYLAAVDGSLLPKEKLHHD